MNLAVKGKRHDSHNAWYIADSHSPIISPTLSLLIFAAVRLFAGRWVVCHFDRRPAGFLTLTQLPQLFGKSRQILEDEKLHVS